MAVVNGRDISGLRKVKSTLSTIKSSLSQKSIDELSGLFCMVIQIQEG